MIKDRGKYKVGSTIKKLMENEVSRLQASLRKDVALNDKEKQDIKSKILMLKKKIKGKG